MSSSTTPLSLTDIINNTLSDYKAFDVTTLNVAAIASFTENMIIASATSNRHAKALAEHCIDAAKKAEFPVLSLQGEADGEWILVDFGSVILHVMQATTRDFYQLEKLWSVQECNIAS